MARHIHLHLGDSQRSRHFTRDATAHDPKNGQFTSGKGVSGKTGTAEIAKAHNVAAEHHRASAKHYEEFGRRYSHPGYQAHTKAAELHGAASGSHTALRIGSMPGTFTKERAEAATKTANAATKRADYEWEPKKRDEGRYER